MAVTNFIDFPSVAEAEDDGLLAMGGSLDVDWLLSAYQQGVFPWPQEGMPILWFAPPRRGVLEFSRLHWSKSFLKFQKKCQWTFSIDRDFASVIAHCARTPRPGQTGTWITKEMLQAYIKFHKAGYAHSVEIWDEAGNLVGGIYGVYVSGVFSAESMFYLVSNASKLALFYLIQHLQSLGQSWMDVQMLTPITEGLGGFYEEREMFMKRLAFSQNSSQLAEPFIK